MQWDYNAKACGVNDQKCEVCLVRMAFCAKCIYTPRLNLAFPEKVEDDNITRNRKLETHFIGTRKWKHMIKLRIKKVDTYVDNLTRNRKLETHFIGTRKMEWPL